MKEMKKEKMDQHQGIYQTLTLTCFPIYKSLNFTKFSPLIFPVASRSKTKRMEDRMGVALENKCTARLDI